MIRLIEWSSKTFVDELTGETLKEYRDSLTSKGKDGKPYQPDTACNKLMTITTVLNNNPLCPTKPPLPVSEFPDKKETIPDPYTLEGFNGFMLHPDYEDALRIYAYITSGMRDQEWMYAEKADINWDLALCISSRSAARDSRASPRPRCARCPRTMTFWRSSNCDPRGRVSWAGGWH